MDSNVPEFFSENDHFIITKSKFKQAISLLSKNINLYLITNSVDLCVFIYTTYNLNIQKTQKPDSDY